MALWRRSKHTAESRDRGAATPPTTDEGPRGVVATDTAEPELPEPPADPPRSDATRTGAATPVGVQGVDDPGLPTSPGVPTVSSVAPPTNVVPRPAVDADRPEATPAQAVGVQAAPAPAIAPLRAPAQPVAAESGAAPAPLTVLPPVAAESPPGADVGRDEPWAVDGAPRPSDRTARPLPRVIAVANQKGGVGKTTTTVNLGSSLALLGYRVLVVDLDPQGNATTGLGVDGRGFQHSMYDVLLADTPMVDCIEPVGIENLFVAPATLDLAGVEQELFSALSRELRLKRALTSVVDDYDFVLVDCPPSLGLITINAFAAAGEILVPVQCEFYALEGLTQLQRIVSLVQRNLNEELEISTVVLTMYDARTRLSEDVANEVRRHFPTQTQGTVIPRTVRLSEAPSFGQPITTFDPASKGARAYKALAREVSDGAEKRAG